MPKSIHGGDNAGEKIEYDFSVNINPLPTPETVKQAMREALGKADIYPDYYSRDLISALAGHYGIREEMIAVGNGSSELFTAVVNALSPCRILIPVPSFYGYEYAANRRNNTIDYVGRENIAEHIAGNFTGNNAGNITGNNAEKPDNARKAEDGKYDLIFLANPNNPTGRLWDEEELLSVLSLAKKNDTTVVLDECFYELTKGRHSMFNHLSEYPNLIVVNSFTKTYSIPGIRIGFLACFDTKKVERIKRELPEWNVSVIAQAAGVACLKCADHPAASVEVIAKEREFLTAGLNRLGIQTFASDTNFILIYDERPLYDLLLGEGILIRDASNFRGLGEGFFRIAVRNRAENEELVRRLETVLHGKNENHTKKSNQT